MGFKKLISLIFTSFVILLLFSGCGQNGPTFASSNTQTNKVNTPLEGYAGSSWRLLRSASYSYKVFSIPNPSIPTYPNINDIVQVGTSRLVAVGDLGQIFESTDNGSTWRHLATVFNPSPLASYPSPYPNLHSIAYTGSHFIAVGDSGAIAISHDNGVTWTTGFMENWGAIYTSTGTPGMYYHRYKVIWVNSSARFVILGVSGLNFGSADKGYTWIKQHDLVDISTNTPPTIYDAFIKGQNLVAFGESGYVFEFGQLWSAWNSLNPPNYKLVAQAPGINLYGMTWWNEPYNMLGVGDSRNLYTFIPSTPTWSVGYSPYLGIGFPMIIMPTGRMNSIASSGGVYVTVGVNGQLLYGGPSGWTPVLITSQNLNRVVWTGTQFVIVGNMGTVILSP